LGYIRYILSFMNINVIALFPEVIKSSLVGVTGKAFENGKAKLNLVDLKDFSTNSYGSVDDSPYGGGEGMVMCIEPLEKALKSICSTGKVVNLSPQGEIFNHRKAIELSLLDNITFICGRYEGIDQRFIDSYVDEEISIGDFVLSGGEIAASVIIDSMLRNLPGVIGNQDSVNKDSHSHGKLKGYSFTKPAIYDNQEVPKVLTSGDHEKIANWKLANSLWVTKQKRPDLFEQLQLSEKEMILLRDYESGKLS